ncbi:unnamed protein product, partial [Musa acuminata subsp. burmannicoides]
MELDHEASQMSSNWMKTTTSMSLRRPHGTCAPSWHSCLVASADKIVSPAWTPYRWGRD